MQSQLQNDHTRQRDLVLPVGVRSERSQTRME